MQAPGSFNGSETSSNGSSGDQIKAAAEALVEAPIYFRGSGFHEASTEAVEAVEAMNASMEAVEASRHSLKVVEVNCNRWKFAKANGIESCSSEASMEASTGHLHGSFH